MISPHSSTIVSDTSPKSIYCEMAKKQTPKRRSPGRSVQGTSYTHTEKQAITGVICDHVKAGKTLATACKNSGISDSAFRRWRREKPDLSEIYTRACEERMTKDRVELREIAEKSLRKMVRGFKVKIKEDVVKLENGKLETIEVTKERYIQPSVQAIELILTNPDGDTDTAPMYVKRVLSDVNHSGSVGGGNVIDLTNLSDKELATYEKLVSKCQTGE